jgi:HK97 family phage major capsid protein
MIQEIRKAVDELGQAFMQFKTANEEALRQKQDRGASDGLTEQKIERLNDDIDRLRDRLERTQAVLNRQSGVSDPARLLPGADEHKAAFLRYMQKGEDAALINLERKALSVGADYEGGYSVPAQLSANIITTIRESSPIRAYAAVETITTDSLELLVDKDQAGVGWVAEVATRDETSAPNLAKIIIPVYEMYAEPRATQKLIDDSLINIETWLAEKVAERFGRLEGVDFPSHAHFWTWMARIEKLNGQLETCQPAR